MKAQYSIHNDPPQSLITTTRVRSTLLYFISHFNIILSISLQVHKSKNVFSAHRTNEDKLSRLHLQIYTPNWKVKGPNRARHPLLDLKIIRLRSNKDVSLDM